MEKLQLSQITISNPYLRNNTDIETLKKSIETIGLINPLTVNDKNELIAGGRRYQALKELEIEEVEVSRVNCSELEQELISIDENLVRKPLDKLELENCLNRGRDIYEQLNPNAEKIDLEIKELTPDQKKQEKEKEENDTTSFAAITSEKTGLSKSVIKNAIKRDARSSETIKQARGSGDISASQVNEIIKLKKEEQDEILPYIKEKSVKDVRKIVKKAREEGISQAIQASQDQVELPKEFIQLENMAKKCNKILTKVIIENMDIDENDMKKVFQQLEKLKKQSTDFLNLYGQGEVPMNSLQSPSVENVIQ